MRALSMLCLLVAQNAVAALKGDVHAIDWLNRVYDTDWTDGPSMHVDGLWQGKARGMSRVTVALGDVTGDGVDDAVLFFVGNGGGSGYFSWIEVRTAQDEIIGRVPGGDRAFGGIKTVEVVDGNIELQRMSAGPDGGACCPAFILDETWVWVGDGFEERRLDHKLAGRRLIHPLGAAHLAAPLK